MTIWRRGHRFDPAGRALADRHYSRQKPGSPQYPLPDLACVTFVDSKQVPGILCRGERVKGFCFWKAGFRAVGETKKGLIAWQLLPAEMPAPQAIGAAA